MIAQILKVNEFRGIRKLEEPLALKKFNVLIGKNNSGKSSLLEALFLFPHPGRNYALTPKAALYFLAEKKSGSTRSLIYKYDGTATLKFYAKLEKEFEEWEIKIPSKGTPMVIRNDYKIRDSLKFDKTIYFPNDTEFMKSLDHFLTDNESKILKNEIHKIVARHVSNQLDENFTEIVLKRDGWYFRREDASYIHISDVGDGVKKFTRAMMICELIKPKLILWDDFDTSLHPSMIKALLRWLAEGEWQVVLATHSIDIPYYLAELNEELDEFDAQLVLLKKDQNDILHHKELTMSELENLLEANIDPRMLVNELKI